MFVWRRKKTDLTQRQTYKEIEKQDPRVSVTECGFHKPLSQQHLLKHRLIHNIETAVLF